MKPTKQTVYLPIKEHSIFKILESGIILQNCYPEEGYFFTSEQLNEYIKGIIEKSLETAAENAEVKVTENALIEDGSCYTTYDDGVISVTSDKQSIINTFEETFKKFSVE